MSRRPRAAVPATLRSRAGVLAAAASLGALAAPALAENLHYTYLWHLEQPIYWPDQKSGSPDRYEHAWESITRKDAGATYPLNDLRGIFGLPDRVNVYQWRVKDAIDSIRWLPEAGAQISYSGGLIRNIQSLGATNQLGYSSSWNTHNRTARSWNTIGQSKPRLDVVLFSFHHALLPLVDENTVRKELQLYKAVYAEAWGSTVPMSRGFFPSEMAFSTRLIKPLAQEGVAWSIVSSEKISRANANFPMVFGSGGANCDPPNRADQVNPAQANYYRQSISRGCSPAEAFPQSMTPQRARSVDPATGQVYELIVVPASQSLGWRDGFAPIGLADFHALNAQNNPSRPQLVILAHDGDNAWGGGYSYYVESTPQLASQANSAGYVPTVIEEYLADHPVPADAVVHVEDGAWVNADGDFGAPQYINWNWPLLSASGQIDVENGWHVDARNWAVITAMQNRVETAEQIQGPVRIDKVAAPDASTTAAERAWHYFLGSLNSGYMYYGSDNEFEVKPTVACNEAAEHADPVIGAGTLDQTAPSIWAVQRHPWNPGSVNFGPQFGYQQRSLSSDFWVWSFIYDVSGLSTVTLKYRIDADGANPLNTWQNETYAGGSEVGAWQSVPMTFRDFPAGNVFNQGDINFFEMPVHIADQYHAKITGVTNALVDYYIEATDSRGFTKRSPIHHVWVGDGQGTPPTGPVVTVAPSPPVAGQSATITYNATGRPLAGAPTVRAHVGFNTWATVLSPDPVMTAGPNQTWTVNVTIPSTATVLDLAFNNGASTWDNNGGADWHVPVTGGVAPPTFVMDGQLDPNTTLLAGNTTLSLRFAIQGDVLYLAMPDAGEGNDHFIYLAGENGPGPLQAANWAKAGQIARWDAFLADENNNDFEGWFDATGTRQAATGANGGVLEGTINLREEVPGAGGGLPTRIYLAAAAYGTNDAGELNSFTQVPTPTNFNGSIEAGEYYELVLAPPIRCLGDADGSLVVNFADITSVLTNFGATYTPGTTGPGDADGDGSVIFSDITAVLTRFGVPCP